MEPISFNNIEGFLKDDFKDLSKDVLKSFGKVVLKGSCTRFLKGKGSETFSLKPGDDLGWAIENHGKPWEASGNLCGRLAQSAACPSDC